MIQIAAGALLAMVALAPCTRAQTRPEDGAHEIEFWAGGGHAVTGSTSSDSAFNLGARLGWVLTRPIGPGFLKGRFEYAVDVMPVFMIFQPANRAYGAGFNPVNLKWNFETHGRIVPYVELGGGVVFTNVTVPTGTSRVNFTPTTAIGMHVLGERFNWSIELRYMHISNAGLTTPNPGINTIQARIGFGWFTQSLHGDHGHGKPKH